MKSTYSLKTQNICPDTGDMVNLSVAIEASEFIPATRLIEEIKRLAANPIARPDFTRQLGSFCQSHTSHGRTKSIWIDADATVKGANVSDFEISCATEW